MPSLAVIILTYNEELHLARALASVREIAQEVFVIDSGSRDRTVEIAEAAGAKVLTHEFISHSKQLKWALQNAPITSDWVMRLDADEVIEPDLARSLATELPSLSSDVTGVNLNRKHIFMGRWIRYGGRYPLLMLRVWRRGKAQVEDRWMDEHMVLTCGRAITVEGGFADHNLQDLTSFTAKHNRYATHEAIDVLLKKYELRTNDIRISAKSASAQAAGKRFIKEAIYNRIPFWLSSLGYFIYRYFVRLGFLDGPEGIIYHFLQGYWYRFLVGAKVVEFERVLAEADDRSHALLELARLTGYDVSELT
ncbi:MAG TPA: glycosyltransferase family 2 protein [Bradyrhizobium sp.]|nr:glycosyltransferase family 2 protein [Bradyrhizobium sp.]